MKQRAEIASIVSPRDGNDKSRNEESAREGSSINSRDSWPWKKTPIITLWFFFFSLLPLVGILTEAQTNNSLLLECEKKNILPWRTGGFSGRDETRKTRNARCRFQRIHYRTFTSITEFPFCRLDRRGNIEWCWRSVQEISDLAIDLENILYTIIVDIRI